MESDEIREPQQPAAPPAQAGCDGAGRQTTQQRLQAAYAALEERTAQLQALAVELTQAEQRERRRLAELLHNHFQQLLVSARLRLELLRRKSRDEAVTRAAAQVDEIIEQCLSESRSLTAELSPPVLHESGLAAALEWLGDLMGQRYGLATAVEADRRAEPADENLRDLLFLAVQELLFNVVKHAQVDRARVAMTKTAKGEISIVVSDAGVGFDASQMEGRTSPTGGFGLFSIRQRLGLLAGQVEITSAPGKGTRAVIRVPRNPAGHRRAEAAAVSDPPPFHCPDCGRSSSIDADAAKKQERFLKGIFDRQDELQKSVVSAIHDGLAQQLVGALLHFEGSQQSQDGPHAGGQNAFRVGLQLLRDSIHQAQRLVGRLQPLIPDGQGIALGIQNLVYDLQSQSLDGPKIVFLAEGEADRPVPALENAVFRIVRELLTNACLHSQSDEVRLVVMRTNDRLRLEIEDWGIGFDAAAIDGDAFGLQEVRQRVRLLGGEVSVDSVPGKGTRVVVSFPVDEVAPTVIAPTYIS